MLNRRQLLTAAAAGAAAPLAAQPATGTAQYPAHHVRPAAVGDHRRPVGLSHSQPQPSGQTGHALRTFLHALRRLLSGPRHDPLRRLPLAQRRLQPDPFRALRTSRHVPGRRALLQPPARCRLSAGVRRQVACLVGRGPLDFGFDEVADVNGFNPKLSAEGSTTILTRSSGLRVR